MPLDYGYHTNAYHDHSVPTAFPCVRCITETRNNGAIRSDGKCCCCFVPKGIAELERFYKHYSIVGDDGATYFYMVCGRCRGVAQECIAPPEECREKVQQYQHETMVWRAYVDKREYVPLTQGEPGYNPPPADDDDLAEWEPVLRVPNQAEYFQAVFNARQIAGEIIQYIDQHKSPHHAHLYRHSGALEEEEDPESAVRPTKSDRNRASQAAKEAARVRKLEADTEEVVLGTPKKPRVENAKAKKARIEALQAEIAVLKADFAKLKANQKGKKSRPTKAMVALKEKWVAKEKEVDALE